MTSAEVSALLADALDAVDAIDRFICGRTITGYLADSMLRAAVERKFIIIGEPLAALRRLDPATAARIPMLADAVRFRNVLVHGYAVVTDERVWATAVEHLPTLRSAIGPLLEGADDTR